MEKFIDFSDGKAILENNADWLLGLNYIDFIRDIGAHFSVNRMLAAECFKSRMEVGLSFLEFNYMLMQGYDFLVLNQKHGCTMQLGGDDQWSNMIAGVELIRKKEQKQAFAMTCTLLTNSEGKKMGKTAKRLSALEGAEINEAKKILAFEITKMIHGEEEALKAKTAAEALFGGGQDMSSVPSVEIEEAVLGIGLIDFLVEKGILKTKSEGRRLVQQNGLNIGDSKVTDFTMPITKDLFANGEFLVKIGKKKYHKVVLK